MGVIFGWILSNFQSRGPQLISRYLGYAFAALFAKLGAEMPAATAENAVAPAVALLVSVICATIDHYAHKKQKEAEAPK